ncbi:hypothetical protein ACRALDRAFT_2015379 [Sodiomyces alcalophilus JCM 7366]|uniref:uncharacterized protein n=1 Tax=Sodiomyces alcalophilus JCM 7366 TaxID=591952 RepID=UPI0039B584EB
MLFRDDSLVPTPSPTPEGPRFGQETTHSRVSGLDAGLPNLRVAVDPPVSRRTWGRSQGDVTFLYFAALTSGQLISGNRGGVTASGITTEPARMSI